MIILQFFFIEKYVNLYGFEFFIYIYIYFKLEQTDQKLSSMLLLSIKVTFLNLQAENFEP